MRLLIALALLLSGIAVAQNGPCSEKPIQDQLAKPDAAFIWADDACFFSRAIDKPVVGKANLDQSMKGVDAKRKNQKYDTPVARTVVSPNGDMAYEYGTSHVAFDNSDKQHEDFTALSVRVWKAADGQGKIAGFMAQPQADH